MVGLLDSVRGYPRPEVWFIGLLLFSLEKRNNGFGEKIVKYLEDWIQPNVRLKSAWVL